MVLNVNSLSFNSKVKIVQTRKISKKWSAKYKQQLEEKLEMESKQHSNGSQSGWKTRGFKFFSRRKLNSGADETVENGGPKSPSGRLTKYFSGIEKYFAFFPIVSAEKC